MNKITNTVSFPHIGLKLRVNRVAFGVLGVNVYWYGIIICLATLVGAYYCFKECHKKGIKSDDVVNAILWGIPVSIIFARLYYVIFKFKEYVGEGIFGIFNIRNGGLAIYGAIFGAVLTCYVYCKKKSINPFVGFDILAVSLLIGQTIGRWGNFFNCEAYGNSTKFFLAMTISGVTNVSSVHPTFLYESLWDLAGVCLLINYKKKYQKLNGELFCAYMFWYGLGRAWIEGLRADSLMFFSLRVSQIVSLVICVIGIVLIVKMRKRPGKMATILGSAADENVVDAQLEIAGSTQTEINDAEVADKTESEEGSSAELTHDAEIVNSTEAGEIGDMNNVGSSDKVEETKDTDDNYARIDNIDGFEDIGNGNDIEVEDDAEVKNSAEDKNASYVKSTSEGDAKNGENSSTDEN